MRRRDGEVSAQKIEPFVRTGIFADREVEGRAVTGWQGRGATAVMHDVTRIAGKQQDVARPQPQWSSSRRIVQRRRAGQHGVIRDFVRFSRPLIDAPWRAVGAAQIEPPAYGHHFESRLSQSMAIPESDDLETMEHIIEII